jgi:predicted Fe-Mo cluster-binding NifX family protein
MRIAIPTFATRVSPRFDCARTVLLVTVEDGRPTERHELVAADWAPHERINKLVELGVDVVICGGIDCWSAESLHAANIVIHCCVRGEAEDALEQLLRGELVAHDAAAAGRGRGMGQGQGMRRGGGRGRGGGGGRRRT